MGRFVGRLRVESINPNLGRFYGTNLMLYSIELYNTVQYNTVTNNSGNHKQCLTN